VAISFDADHETIPLRDGETRPGKLSQGQYGSRVAAPKVLALLAEYRVPASFFMPAVSALLHPAEVESYVAGGHEVAVHGWIHERNMLLSREHELDLTGRAVEVLEKLSGTRPVGIRTPSWDFSDNTLAIIRQLGLGYDSSLMADDDPYELVAEGRRTGIVEIPVEWIRDDAPYLMMERYGALRPYTPPRALFEIWRDEFDAAYAEGGVFQLTMHPHVIGHRSRLVVLRDLLAHITGREDVWCATHAQIAEVARAQLTPGTETPA
jgi:peptidoglycan/xylan/chitin deacetylase (PgdA/CDA1 family)